MNKQYFVYIMRNKSGTFYIGITSSIKKRVWEHKQQLVEGFTKKYNINQLIYIEEYKDPNTAIAREKQLKNWNRKKKIDLIIKINPKFEDIPLNLI